MFERLTELLHLGARAIEDPLRAAAQAGEAVFGVLPWNRREAEFLRQADVWAKERSRLSEQVESVRRQLLPVLEQLGLNEHISAVELSIELSHLTAAATAARRLRDEVNAATARVALLEAELAEHAAAGDGQDVDALLRALHDFVETSSVDVYRSDKGGFRTTVYLGGVGSAEGKGSTVQAALAALIKAALVVLPEKSRAVDEKLAVLRAAVAPRPPAEGQS